LTKAEIAPFTRVGLGAGALGAAPLAPSVAMYAVAFGIMASAAGLTTVEAALISGWVNAGGAQMASLQVWSTPVSLVAVCLTTLAMNARYLLMGATLRPWFDGLPAHQVYPSLFVMGDATWTLALREREEGRTDAAFMLGAGLVMWVVWVAGTAVGHVFGSVLGSPERLGIDFLMAAFFAALAVPFLRTAKSLVPFAVGVLVAILVDRMVPGPWSVIGGALAGSAVGAFGSDDSSR
jgi:4-azaleucine resistance transporter AzlC